MNGIITQVQQISPIMKIFKIKPVGWELPEFKPGQFCALGLPASSPRCADSTEDYEEFAPDKMLKRAYSIASATSADELEFYITLVHSGALTPRLFNLNVGDSIQVGKRFVGMFTLDSISPDQNIILIATGTGVAPYMSMLRTDALTRKGKITVIHGAANSWDLGYSSELRLLESVTGKLTYIPTITEPDKEPVEWKGETKFIQDLWTDRTIEKKMGYKPTPENTHVFICGNPKMIETMQGILEGEGFVKHKPKTPGQIHIESF
ncbi:ferredoxin--NADP reductase [Balneicella halophila]|nr:ferredoxin--NADP reductase [Balneicella halophila]